MDYKSGGIPETIDELKDYCERNGYTPDKTRFFVGEDFKNPKAFGIYKDEVTGEFVVYKNKADGSRAIRYSGKDERHAVAELYDRLQQEIGNQKMHYAADMAERERNKYERKLGFSRFDSEDYSNEQDPYLDGKKDYDYERRERTGMGTIGFVVALIMLIMTIAVSKTNSGSGSGSGGYSSGSRGGYGSYNNYDSYDNYHSYGGYNSWDSGGSSWDTDSWSSDNWDSGYTDWDSDW